MFGWGPATRIYLAAGATDILVNDSHWSMHNLVPEAVHVPLDADRDTIEACRLEVERRMQEATREAEAWVEHL